MNKPSSFYSLIGALICSAVLAFSESLADDITSATLEDTGRTLLVTIGAVPFRFSAPEGTFYQNLVLSSNRQKVFVDRKRISSSGGWFHDDIYEFCLADFSSRQMTYGLRAIPLSSGLQDAAIQEIFASSPDGTRLLVSVHYCYESEGDRKRFRWHPYFFDTQNGEITIVSP